MKKAFVSGPYTLGDVGENIKVAMDISSQLLDLGYNVMCPHLFHFLHLNKIQPYNKWLEITIDWLKSCDCMIRIVGPSKGADEEERIANSLGIPVYYSISELERTESLKEIRKEQSLEKYFTNETNI